ncbi:aminoacyl-tRNA hydrolase [Advenella sp. S44]|uniref:aminoacyl-tRNA hydrolase n=1 Tax=Advenella sp. S44 TaxID=1982755 RepID=UPI000C29D663|nr:aminoacyl-tRNA hydrolase [Advenella sp. S44]PJX21082.1 aminoacyl-tRNA hydrolase [Advenella sp. S44]
MASLPIRLIVGLGNPGQQYESTRHNAGFWLADHYADDLKTQFTLETGFFGQLARARHDGQAVYLLKPATYMNRSGQSVGTVARFFKIESEQVLVLHDELDLPPGDVKLKKGGGHAGHNGLRDIQTTLGTADYWRLRLGIGHPRDRGLAQGVADYVLSMPGKEEMPLIDYEINSARQILISLLDGDFAAASRRLAALRQASP